MEDERMRFVIRLKDGEKMAALCKEFGISRKTGYKIFTRFEHHGLEGLTDRSRCDRHHLWTHLLREAQGQSQYGVSWPEGRPLASRRAHLARQLYGL